MIDIRQSVHYANYMARSGWKVISAAGIYYYFKKIPLLGNVLKLQRPEEIRIKKIKELTKTYHVFYVIIEPQTALDANLLISQGYKLTKSSYLPTKTLQIDLTQTSKQIKRGMKKDTKVIFRGLNKVVKSVKNLESSPEAFFRAWKKAVGFRRYVLSVDKLRFLKKCFRKKALFLLAADGSAGAIFLQTDKITYYYQAFTSKSGRKAHNQYRIVFDGLSWAKRTGTKIFDFEGIYDERFPNGSWKGFSHFKKSFGGYEVAYPGCYTKTAFLFKR
jgi:lipid II:glycine glycyltransferase (peptidoglycan interpeptide bridge formation enzyme)